MSGQYLEGMNMKIIADTTAFTIENETAVAIGKFDGFHIGHQKLLKQLMNYKKDGLQTVVFTFFPSPACLFSKDTFRELTIRKEKRMIFERAGVDVLIEYPFNRETAAIAPKAFIEEILVNKLHAKCIVAGADITFGDKGAGNKELLCSEAEKYGMTIEIIEKVRYHNMEISSTLVRDAVQEGRIEDANRYLGIPYHIFGKVSAGKQIGRTIGMPTVNIYPYEEKLLPPFGVYFSEVDVEGRRYRGITNIGIKPTVTDEKKISVETFLYNFSEDIYGKEICVYLFHYRRPEMRFENIDALKTQMESDIEAGRSYMPNTGA